MRTSDWLLVGSLALLGVGLPIVLVAKIVGVSWLKAALLGGAASAIALGMYATGPRLSQPLGR